MNAINKGILQIEAGRLPAAYSLLPEYDPQLKTNGKNGAMAQSAKEIHFFCKSQK